MNSIEKLALLQRVETDLLAGVFVHNDSEMHSHIRNINALTARWLVEEERIRGENQAAKD